MELNHRIYELSVQGNLEGQTIKAMLNGKEIEAGDTCVQLKHIFKKHWFETGKIVGYSILEYYNVKDGFLEDKDGNQIHFSSERFPEIKINRIKKPGLLVFGEIDVDRKYVCDVASILNVNKVDELVKELSPEDKKAIKDERDAVIAEMERKQAEQAEADAKLKAEEDEKLAGEARKAEEEAVTAAEIKKAEEATKLAEEEAAKSEADRIKKEKEAEDARIAEEEAKVQAEKTAELARIAEEEAKKKKEEEEKDYVVTKKGYETLVRRDEKKGFKEYTKDPYHFVYGALDIIPKGEKPYIMKKREDGKYETLAGGVVNESETEVEYEFTDDKDYTLILDIENEDITIDLVD